MQMSEMLKLSVALAFMVIGLVGLGIMFTSETSTTVGNFDEYANWALGAGLVFISVGGALTAFDRDENIVTEFDEEKTKL
jgi:hypothetical protein